jgi:hypothetical protein
MRHGGELQKLSGNNVRRFLLVAVQQRNVA